MSSKRSALRNTLEYWCYLAARRVAALLGRRALARLGTVLGDLYHLLGRSRRRILERNLALALPELDAPARARLAREVARHFGRVGLDAIRQQRLGPEALMAEVEIIGREHLDEALAEGRGVFLLSAHIGSWEVAALIAGLLIETGFAVVNRPLDNPRLERALAGIRERFGNRALGKHRVARDMLRQLRSGGAVGILIDQRSRVREAVEVPFFGHPAWTHPILARLALHTSAPVVPIWGVWVGPGRYQVIFGEPVRAEALPEAERTELALTARLLAITEQIIREHPEQWLWYHDRWRPRRKAEAGGS